MISDKISSEIQQENGNKKFFLKNRKKGLHFVRESVIIEPVSLFKEVQ